MKKKKSKFKMPSAIEREYEKRLREIAKQSHLIVKNSIKPDGTVDETKLFEQADKYSEIIGVWAVDAVKLVYDRCELNDRKRWAGISKGMSHYFQMKLKEDGSMAMLAKQWQNDQVGLIKSLPLSSAYSAQKVAFNAAITGQRADSIVKRIERMGSITESRARLIARTEIAKANTKISEARALSVGITHYIWRTMEDEDVRQKHKDLDGKVFAYNDPPEIPGEGRHGPGEFPNCRCYADPVIDKELFQ